MSGIDLASMRYMGRRATRPPNPGVLGANVLRLRRERGWSQHELARRAHLSRSTISAIELGKYDSADLSTAGKLAGVFGVLLTDLVGAQVAESAAHPVVQAFLDSRLRAALDPTFNEIVWLRSLPSIMWTGARPEPETVAKIILWRRESGGRT